MTLVSDAALGGLRHDPGAVLDPAAIPDRAVEAAARRISADLPLVPVERILAVLDAHLDATRDAKVQNFRVLLAERRARQALRAARSAPAPLPDGATTTTASTDDGTDRIAGPTARPVEPQQPEGGSDMAKKKDKKKKDKKKKSKKK